MAILKIGEKKGLVVLNNKDYNELLEIVKAACGESKTASSLITTIESATDRDPFVDSRLYLAKGYSSKATGLLKAAIEILEKGS